MLKREKRTGAKTRKHKKRKFAAEHYRCGMFTQVTPFFLWAKKAQTIMTHRLHHHPYT
jgi:hypothetical protein